MTHLLTPLVASPRHTLLVRLAVFVLVALLVPAALFAQQPAAITGKVTDAATGEPLVGANVLLEGTALGSATNVEGVYRIDVPAARVTNAPANLIARFVGYRASKQTITLTATSHVVNFSLATDVFRLEEVVVTGVAGAVEKAKLPFTVERLTETDLQTLTHLSMGTMVQGKVAGVTVVQGSGRPGAPPSFLLRGPTSINSEGRDQEPLYIVDGVVLSASMVDFDALDIESVEIIKGAAAASLYGSRAAQGVIQITTRRGHRMAENMVRYTVRSEIGESELVGTFPLSKRHQYLMHPDNPTKFYEYVGATDQGAAVDYQKARGVRYAGQMAPRQTTGDTRLPLNPTIWNTFVGNDWPQTYDHIKDVFRSNRAMQNYIAAEGRSGRTNFHASISHLRDRGVMTGLDGFERFNFRLNLDQLVRPGLNVSGTAFISRSTDDLFTESQGNVLFRLTRMPAGVDLWARDENGELYIRPDPQKENDNPLYELLNRDWNRTRGRYLGSANVRYTPFNWLILEADASFDRLNVEDQDFYNKGYRTARASSVNTGYVYKYNSIDESFNTAYTATLLFNVGDLKTTTQGRFLYEDQRWRWQYGSGYELGASGVPSLHNVGGTPTVRSQQGVTKYMGYYLIANLDYKDRYILDALVRRDGSSLFGADERWKTYYRAAVAWRISEEPWFNIDLLDQFKLRYSIGTAGGRPAFYAQYETYSVAAGILTPVAIGNRELKPEYATEHEAGLELAFLKRISLDVTYASSTVDDQILRVPLPGYSGFVNQWRNAGTLASNTWEVSLNAHIFRERDFSWSARVTFDRTRQKITKLDVPDFTYGVSGQGMDRVFYAREGEKIGTFYGFKWARSIEDLHPNVRNVPGVERLFQVNDDGFLVYVGEGRSWRDGWNVNNPSQNLWGTSATVGGRSFSWGTPITAWGYDRITGELTQFLPIGNTEPDFRIALSTTLNYKQFGLYVLVDAEQGFDVWNQPLQWSVFEEYAGIMDQAGKSPETVKPIGYYAALYNSLTPTNDYWVEDGSYVKLREITLRYTFTAAQLASFGLRMFSGATISVSGRNLYTWTDYRGYDPEIGRAGGDVGSAAIARVDGYQYPNYRTWRFGIEFNL